MFSNQQQKNKTLQLNFKPSEIRSTNQPNTFSAHQQAFIHPSIYQIFWNSFLLTKHSDQTIQVLGKAKSYDFFHDSNTTFEYNKESYWTRQMRI